MRCVLLASWVFLGASGALAQHSASGASPLINSGAFVPPPYVTPPPLKEKDIRVERRDAHEVWLMDQSNSPGRTYGGTLYIYNPEQLRRNAATAVPEVIDLGGATAALCLAETGANPVRPHMGVFNTGGNTHLIFSFVASGHVVFMDARTRTPVRCFRTEPGVAGLRQAHAIWPTPDDKYILVANQNGKKVERIRTDYRTNTFTQEPAATLNLATCITPNGLPCQDPTLRPDNAPICPFIPERGFPLYMSLRGGGMLAIDHATTPMSIVAEYDAQNVPRDGCGFLEAKGFLYGNGGGGNVLNPDGWFLYRLPIGGRSVYKASNPPNTPAVFTVDRDDSIPRDAHGVGKTRDSKYSWFFDRAGNVVEIFNTRTADNVAIMNLAAPGLSLDPTPDLTGEAPDGKFMYVALRGPVPLSGDPHASTGSTPGVMALQVIDGGRFGAVRGIARINNIGADGIQRADAHGIRVRILGDGRNDDDDDDEDDDDDDDNGDRED